ncbi:MAG: exodeoxyribonuclease VII large subunit, partial [Treponema sp.]|nr:exodeoxyribonuclease VII large subunit [Treponema sp.]
EIDWTLSDFAADLRAPTPSAAAELVSENRAAISEGIRDTVERIRGIMTSKLERARLLIRPFSLEDLEYRFRSILQPRLVRFDDAREGLVTALQGRVRELRRRLELMSASLEAASPLAVLERGFSVVTVKAGGKNRLVRRAADVRPGDSLVIRPREGIITAVAE